MEQHLESWNDRLPERMAEILRRMTLSLRGATVSKAKELMDQRNIYLRTRWFSPSQVAL